MMNRVTFIWILLAMMLTFQPVGAQEYPDLSSLEISGPRAKILKYRTQLSAGILIAYQPGPADQVAFLTLDGAEVLEEIYTTPGLQEQLQEVVGGFFSTELLPIVDWERGSNRILAFQLEQRITPKWAFIEQVGLATSDAEAEFDLEFQDFNDLSAPPIEEGAEATVNITAWQFGLGMRRYFKGVVESFIQFMPFYRSLATDRVEIQVRNVTFSPGADEYTTDVFGISGQFGVQIPVSRAIRVVVFGGINYEKEKDADSAWPAHIGAGMFIRL